MLLKIGVAIVDGRAERVLVLAVLDDELEHAAFVKNHPVDAGKEEVRVEAEVCLVVVVEFHAINDAVLVGENAQKDSAAG